MGCSTMLPTLRSKLNPSLDKRSYNSALRRPTAIMVIALRFRSMKKISTIRGDYLARPLGEVDMVALKRCDPGVQRCYLGTRCYARCYAILH